MASNISSWPIGLDDLVLPFIYVPYGAPDPVGWKARHPGWFSIPATFIPYDDPVASPAEPVYVPEFDDPEPIPPERLRHVSSGMIADRGGGTHPGGHSRRRLRRCLGPHERGRTSYFARRRQIRTSPATRTGPAGQVA